MPKYQIKDWAGNVKFGGREFDTPEDADDFLAQHIRAEIDGDLTDEQFSAERGEFYVELAPTGD